MRYAVNKDGFISNIIIVEENQKIEMENALGAILEDASIYGLQIGDFWVEGKGWTRNIDGEQHILQPLTPNDWSQYQSLSDELETLKATSIEEDELNDAYMSGVNSI